MRQPSWLYKGELCLTSLVAFYDGVIATVNKKRPTDVIYNIPRHVRLLTWSIFIFKLKKHRFQGLTI